MEAQLTTPPALGGGEVDTSLNHSAGVPIVAQQVKNLT